MSKGREEQDPIPVYWAPGLAAAQGVSACGLNASLSLSLGVCGCVFLSLLCQLCLGGPSRLTKECPSDQWKSPSRVLSFRPIHWESRALPGGRTGALGLVLGAPKVSEKRALVEAEGMKGGRRWVGSKEHAPCFWRA